MTVVTTRILLFLCLVKNIVVYPKGANVNIKNGIVVFLLFSLVNIALYANAIDKVISQDKVILIGRIAIGMRKIIKKRDNGKWYYCGRLLNSVEQEEISVAMAYHTVINQQSLGIENISTWGIIATAYNESGFDACALGIYPRKWGYKTGLLKRSRDNNTNVLIRSHSRAEVLNFINSKRAKKKYRFSGFDLGPCQILSRFYRGQESSALTIDKGMRMCVVEMNERARRNKTTKPWLYWKGILPVRWYGNKIRRWARIMGATPKELRGI
jgi:hypothetical protein